MAFGTRHCCCLALLLVITQVMLSTAYNRDTYTPRSRDDDYGDSRDRNYPNSDHSSHGHPNTESRRKHGDDDHDHGDSAATSVKELLDFEEEKE